MDSLSKVVKALSLSKFRVVGSKLISDEVIEASLHTSLSFGDFTCKEANIESNGNILESTKLSIEALSLFNTNLKNTVAFGTTILVNKESKLINCKLSYVRANIHTGDIHNTVFYNCGMVACSFDRGQSKRGVLTVLNTTRVSSHIRTNTDVKLENVKDLVIDFRDHQYQKYGIKDPHVNSYTGNVNSVFVYGIDNVVDLENSKGIKLYLYRALSGLRYRNIEAIGLERYADLIQLIY